MNKNSIFKSLRNCIYNSIKLLYDFDSKYLFILLVVNVIQGVLPVLLIRIMQKVINLLQIGTDDFRNIVILIIIYVLISISSLIIQATFSYYKCKFSLKFSKYINLKILEHVVNFKLEYFENSEVYNVISRAQSQDGSNILIYINEVLGILKQVITILCSIFVLTDYQWWILGTIIFISFIRCMVTIEIDKEWHELRRARTYDERKAWYINFLFLGGKAFKELKIFDLSKYLINKYSNILDKINAQDYGMQKKSTKGTLVIDIIDSLSVGLIYAYTIYMGFSNIILIGDVTAYIECISKIKSSAQSIFSCIPGMVEQSLYINYLFEFFEIPIILNEKGISVDRIQKIELENVIYKSNNGRLILDDINLNLEVNKKIAIVGENGSGKTTLVKLLAGLYDNYEGTIRVNGIDFKSVNKKSYYEKLSSVFQDYVRFEMSIRENVAFGNIMKINEDKYIYDRIKTVNLDKSIQGPDGLDVIIGNWFGKRELSGGEWQRIGIARAIMRNPEIIIFDEPDAALDVIQQNELIKLYNMISQDKIAIYVTHRIQNVQKFAEQIVVLSKGKIIEIGTHDELIEKKGMYFNMYCCDEVSN